MTEISLRPNLRVYFYEGRACIEGERKQYHFRLPDAATERVLQLLEADGCSSRTIDSLANSSETVRRFLEALDERHLLCEWQQKSPAESTRPHARQWGSLAVHTSRPDEAQRNISAAHVLVLGLGGIGSVVLQHLVGAGITRFLLVDMDVVQADNLNRQFLYTTADVGRKKTDAARDYVHSRVPDAEVRCRETAVNSADDVRDILRDVPDLSIAALGIDQPIGYASDIAARTLWECGVASIFGGVGLQRGFFGPLYSPGSSELPPPDPWAKGSPAPGDRDGPGLHGTPYSFGPNNTIVGSWMAAAILYHLAGITDLVEYDRRLIINFETGRMTPQASHPSVTASGHRPKAVTRDG